MKQQLTFLSGRVIQCLIHLCNANDYMTVNDLATAIKTSKRTLFRELKDINDILKAYQVQLESRPKHGVRLVCEQDQRLHFKSILLQIGAHQNNLSKDDRQTILLSELLKNKSLQKLIVYANQFEVSEATISNDIDSLEPQLTKYGLRMLRKPGSNLSIEGNEEAIRKAIRDFVYRHMEEDKLVRLLNQQMPWDVENYFKNQGPDSILNVLNKDILWQVIHILKENDSVWINRLAQNSYIGLILHLTIAIERLKHREPITIDPELLNQLKADPMFDRAKELAEYFEDEFDLDFPIEEIAYISMHLKGARLLHVDVMENLDDHDLFSSQELQKLVSKLIEAFEKLSGTWLHQDDILGFGLVTHLRPALTRLFYKLEIRNPLLSQIKTQYTHVFNLSQEACKLVEDERIRNLNENEVGFIAMHFGAALERIKQNEPKRIVKVAVLCASGIGISSLLASRIKRSLQDTVEVVPRSHLDLSSLQKEQFDLLVSTMEIGDTSIPKMIVNPLLSDEDLVQIQNRVTKLAATAHHFDSVVQEDFVSVMSKQIELNQAVIGLLNNFVCLEVSSKLSTQALMHAIADLASDDNQARLVLYKDLQKRETMGSVVMEDEHFAMFHAKTSVLKTPRMYVLRPTNGVFECYAPAEIQVIVALLIPEQVPAELSQWMSHLSSALLENDAYRVAIFTKTKEVIQSEILNVLKGPMKTWYRKVSG